MKVMSYKGFQATVELDAEDDIFVGHIAGINDIVGFHGGTVAELRAAFEEAVDDYSATCEKVGKPPERAYSGKVSLRIDPRVHANSALAAQLSGKSLNQWSEDVLKAASDAA